MTNSGQEQALSAQFTRFATLEAREASPLYERLALGVADDEGLLALAAKGREEQPAPNVLFASVHLLLLSGVQDDLAAFYPSITDLASARGDPFPHFRRFCHEHADAIAEMLRERRVQTNVVERCGLLLPAFGIIARRSGGKPLALVEVGASAGLNLLWDRYSFDYSGGRRWGSPVSPVRIETELRGAHEPALPEEAVAVAERTGIDLNPIDVRDHDAVEWLRALVWPEERQQRQRLDAAVALARTTPPTLLRGDALDLLPGVLGSAPQGTALCLYHTHTLNQFSPEARRQFARLLADAGAERDLYWLSIEYRPTATGDASPTLTLVAFENGEHAEQILASCDHHGRWLEWLSTGA